MTDHALRPESGYCFQCGGSYFTLGMKSKWVPHDPECPRLARFKKVEAPKGTEAGGEVGGTVASGAVRAAPDPPVASTQSQAEADHERVVLAEVEAPFYPLISWPEYGPEDQTGWYPRQKADYSRKRKV